jgi:hypothetical protein
MVMEFQFEDVVFGIFPKVGGEMSLAFGFWPNNSVGDIVDMLMQMLEVSFYFTYVVSRFSFSLLLKALEFIHDLNIAHRVSTPPFYLSFSLRYSIILVIFAGSIS